MVLNTLWTQIEVVELVNDGSGLGFGISGNKSTGVVVKSIVPGSIADKDGRIHTGDHLFQINHVHVRGMSSEQVAGILRQCSDQVRLVTARSVREPPALPVTTNSSSSLSQSSSFISENFIRSTNPSLSMISDSNGIINNSQNKIYLRTERLLENNHNLEKILDNLLEQYQYEDGTEILDVNLEKGDDGLGITVAGYVSPDSTNNDAIAGIFIRDIADGSVCSRDGRLRIGDQIIEVNDQSLNGFSNVQALYLLQNTSSSVRLKVRRYLDGTKYEKIKEMIALESSSQIEDKIEFQNQSNINEQIHQKWTKILGNNYHILIIDIFKPDHGNLGMTLEGTIDIENGEEIGAHHYIRTLSSESILAIEGTLKSGDELLEINNQVLYGKNHIHVIELLKRIKHQIKLVCARRKEKDSNETKSKLHSTRSRSISFGKTTEIVVKAKSVGTLDSTNASFLRTARTRSLEVISNLTLWSTTILNVELNKDENGLGFSVLDYQDPSNPSYSPVIVIRGLVRGGVTQLDGRILPGDRLVAVNDITFENMNLNDVMKILKSIPKGPVKLSIAKPLPYPKFKNENEDKIITDSDQDVQHKRRLSRISKSRTTTELNKNQKRSISHHRSTKKKKTKSLGIAVSAPAILCKHEFVETVLINTENNIRRKIYSKKVSSLKQSRRLSIDDDSTDIYPTKKSHFKSPSNSVHFNLPEFINFESDHLVLTSQIALYPFSERSRTSLNHSTTKFNRQSTQSRLRHSHDPTHSYHENQMQQQNKFTKRPIVTNKFDSISHFDEFDLSSDENLNTVRSPTLKTRHRSNTEEEKSSTNASLMTTIRMSPPVKQSSPIPSPTLSTGSSHLSEQKIPFMNQDIQQLPVYLERQILIKSNFGQLSLTVDATVDNGINGCCLRSITSIANDICLKPDDLIVSINNESMRNIDNSQARSIIRRATLIGSDINIVYISNDDIKQYKDQMINSQRNFVDSDNEISQTKSFLPTDSYDFIDNETICSTLWGPPRTVILHRNGPTQHLGISIVGGKLDFSGPGNTTESCITGIFIKHVIPDSLAGSHSTLKTGDRIVEVNGCNLRDATHDHAVEIIRSAQSPICFIVQSLFDPSNTINHTQNVEDQSLRKQYEHLEGDILLIDIKRNSNEIDRPLGISLIGHRDPKQMAVFICDIQADSLVGHDNRLKIGDQLLEVNHEILYGKPHSIVTSIIKSIKTEILNLIILRNPNSINHMALRSPYPSNQHNNIIHTNEHEQNDDKLTSTSVFPVIKHSNDVRTDQTSFPSISADVDSNLLNQENKSPSLTTTTKTTTTTAAATTSIVLPNVNQKKIEHITIINEPFVSHMPNMSSSSSSSSLSIPTPILNDQTEILDDPRSRPIIIGKETLIEIDRGQSGLGLSVVGGSDTQLPGIIIHDTYDGCAAQRDGRLLVGDQILEVNSIDLRSATHEQAIQALRQSANIVRMIVLRREMLNEQDKFDIITVDLIKKSGRGLGFSIIGRRHGYGVFISHIIEGGLAEKDGRLMSGDLILEVNGKDFHRSAYEEVAHALKTLPHERVYIKVGRLKANIRQNVSSTNVINDKQ